MRFVGMIVTLQNLNCKGADGVCHTQDASNDGCCCVSAHATKPTFNKTRWFFAEGRKKRAKGTVAIVLNRMYPMSFAENYLRFCQDIEIAIRPRNILQKSMQKSSKARH